MSGYENSKPAQRACWDCFDDMVDRPQTKKAAMPLPKPAPKPEPVPVPAPEPIQRPPEPSFEDKAEPVCFVFVVGVLIYVIAAQFY
jgi:hypothetical protein